MCLHKSILISFFTGEFSKPLVSQNCSLWRPWSRSMMLRTMIRREQMCRWTLIDPFLSWTNNWKDIYKVRSLVDITSILEFHMDELLFDWTMSANFFRLFNGVESKFWDRWLDSNRRPLVSEEAAALPTRPQSLTWLYSLQPLRFIEDKSSAEILSPLCRIILI